MKKVIVFLMAVMAISVSAVTAQTEQINLEQQKGIFSTESLTLAEGDYQFNISNNGVGHEVGFVVVPKGKYDQSNHIQAAYVTSPVKTGSSSLTSVVNLKAGEYEYFCPLNPTPKYPITVVEGVEQLKLGQVEGAFKVEGLTVSEGSYQFEIANNGVDREVGFVLVPKGKYEMSDHIQAAYVSKPVVNGASSKTGIVELTEGEYEYFCPLNPTPKYTLTVKK